MPSQSNRDLGALIRNEISEWFLEKKETRRKRVNLLVVGRSPAINLLIRIQCSRRSSAIKFNVSRNSKGAQYSHEAEDLAQSCLVMIYSVNCLLSS